MVIHHSGCLHEGIANCRADEFESGVYQSFAHRIRLTRLGRNPPASEVNKTALGDKRYASTKMGSDFRCIGMLLATLVTPVPARQLAVAPSLPLPPLAAKMIVHRSNPRRKDLLGVAVFREELG